MRSYSSLDVLNAFESPRFMLRQSQANISELKSIFGAFFKDNKAQKIIEIDQNSGNKSLKLKFTQPIPERARYLAWSTLVDMRHILDQAACAAVEVVTNSDPGRLYFPIANGAADLQGRLNKEFPVEFHPIINAFAPYPTLNGAGGNQLICDLAKAAQRKHRITCKVGAKISGIELKDLTITNGVRIKMPPAWDFEKDEAKICTVRPDGEINGNFNVGMFVAFYNAGPVSGRDTIGFLSDAATVTNRVVDGLEVETRRIVGA